MKRTMKLASRGKRFAAGLIDMIVPFIAYIYIISVYGLASVVPGGSYGFGNNYGYGFDYGYGYNYNLPHSSGAIAFTFVLLILMVAYIVAELVLFARAQSIGKAILGLQVVSTKNGKPFGFWKMMFRDVIVKSASSSVFMLGYIWILIDNKNRSWHDKILDSYVVDLKETASMYQRASMAAKPPAPKSEDKIDPAANTAPPPIVEEIKDPDLEDTAKIKIPDEPQKVEALEAPEKIEALEAPESFETLETREESIMTAGDEQTEIPEKEDEADII